MMGEAMPHAARPPDDLVDFVTAAKFFKPTGHPVSQSTLRRDALAAGVKIWVQGRRHLVSLSDLLVLHGERQDATEV